MLFRSVPRCPAGGARAHRNRSCRWPRAGEAMNGWANHLVIVPILLPLLTGATILLFHERNRALRAGISLGAALALVVVAGGRSEEHTSELQSLMRISSAVFSLKKKNKKY